MDNKEGTLTSKKWKLLQAIDDKVDWNQEMQKLRESASGPNLMSSTKTSPDGPKLSKSQKRRKAKKNKPSSISHLSKAPAGVLITTSDPAKVPTVVFNNPDTRWKGLRGSKFKEGADDSESPGIDVDLKKARYEIMKFGINGLSGVEKVDAETGLAISLGAVPGKRPGINYKELLEKRKEERETWRLQKAASAKPKLKTSVSKTSKTAKRAKKELGGNNIVVKSKLSAGQKKGNAYAKKKSFAGKRPDKRTRMNNKK